LPVWRIRGTFVTGKLISLPPQRILSGASIFTLFNSCPTLIAPETSARTLLAELSTGEPTAELTNRALAAKARLEGRKK